MGQGRDTKAKGEASPASPGEHRDTVPCPQDNDGICSKHLWVPRGLGDGHDIEQGNVGDGVVAVQGLGPPSVPSWDQRCP